jgi:hypothetical protein
MVRYPDGLDFGLLAAQYPELVVVNHELTHVSPNGLPEATYNDGLFEFDSGIRSAFEATRQGSTVLIETFAGKRRYYIYAAKLINVADSLAQVLHGNPHEKLSWEVRSDPDWDFITNYRRTVLHL